MGEFAHGCVKWHLQNSFLGTFSFSLQGKIRSVFAFIDFCVYYSRNSYKYSDFLASIKEKKNFIKNS